MKSRWVLSGICLVILAVVLPATEPAIFAQDKQVVLYFFYGKTCPHCKKIDPEIEALARSYPNLTVKKYEVWYDKNNRNMLLSMAKERGVAAQGVPTIIIGKDVYLGSDMGKIREIVRRNVKK